MAKSSRLRVMISSQCKKKFPRVGKGRALTDIRKELKAEIEALEVFGEPVFEVWINEGTPPKGGRRDSWETCMQAAKDCDVLVALYNGDAGWGKRGGIGICHGELEAGLSQAPAKVRLVSLNDVEEAGGEEGRRNKEFQTYVNKQSLFRGDSVETEDDLKTRVKQAIHDALLALARLGVREASKGSFHRGQALDWSRLDFSARRTEMRRVMRDAMLRRTGSSEDGTNLFVKFAGSDVLVVPDAVPAALTVGPAKELVGQPFLRDHELADHLKRSRGGPVHVIGCHKTATEAQATKLLGFPDAIVVSAPFGVFVADNIQKVQFAFIVNCRDETTTQHGVQRFFEWLSQTGEETGVRDRAKARARIVSVIAKEVTV